MPTRLSQGGTQHGVTAGEGMRCPAGTRIRPPTPPWDALRTASVRPSRRRRGCDQARRACPGGVGQAEVRTGTGRCPVAVMRVRTVPPAGPRAPGWTRQSRRRSYLWLRFWSRHPAAIGQASPSGPFPPGTGRSSGRALHLYRAGMARSPEGGRQRRDDPPQPRVRVPRPGKSPCRHLESQGRDDCN
jgi:hypothetical protein